MSDAQLVGQRQDGPPGPSSDGGNLGDSEVVDIRGDGRKARSATVRPRATFFPNVREMDWDDIVRLARQTVRRGLRRRVRELHGRESLLELRPPDDDDRPRPEREALELNRAPVEQLTPFPVDGKMDDLRHLLLGHERVLPLVAVEALP